MTPKLSRRNIVYSCQIADCRCQGKKFFKIINLYHGINNDELWDLKNVQLRLFKVICCYFVLQFRQRDSVLTRSEFTL